jgi:hypothetical protein
MFPWLGNHPVKYSDDEIDIFYYTSLVNLISVFQLENSTWNLEQSDPSEAWITTKLQENCRLGLIESVRDE